MAKPELINAINGLSKKIDGLIGENKTLQTQVQSLLTENEELKLQHERDRKELQQLLKQIEFLSLSHRLASSSEALIEARKIVSSLIRTIDSCIRLIQED